MSTGALWTRIRRKIGSAGPRQQTITVQYIGVPAQDVDAMQSMFDVLGQQLSVTLELKPDSGEMVLLQLKSGTRVTAEHIHALTGGRPAVFITKQNDAAEQLSSTSERFAVHQRVLLPQLTELPLVRRRSALRSPAGTLPQDSRRDALPSGSGVPLSTSFSSALDSTPSAAPPSTEDTDPAQLEVLQQVLRGLADPATPMLKASYGPNAHLRFDFGIGLVTIDALAQQHLRVRRELPRPAPEAQLHPDAMVRELDETVWHLGLASGHLPLVGEPADWSQTALAVSPESNIERYTKMPRHLEMARRLMHSPVTPAELRRHAHIGVPDLRSFLQACLFLNIIRWVDPSEAGPAADRGGD